MARLGRLSEALIRALHDATGFREMEAPTASLCHAVIELSERFTRKRGALTDAYLDDPRLRLAYLSYYLPVNLAKVQTLLDEMPRPACASRAPGGIFRVLDVGSGPGTTALAVLDWIQGSPDLASMPTEAVSLDRSAAALSEGERLWNVYAGQAPAGSSRFTTVQADVARSDPRRLLAGSDPDPYDLIVIANTLNELFRSDRDPVKRRVALVRGLLNLMDRRGTLMIVEPALRETSRDLHHLRDRLMADRACTVYSPCLHEAPCPALVKEEDWCHEERPWSPPPLVAAIDREVGFIKDALKFSYLLLRKDGHTIVRHAPEVYRVVSELRSMKGEKRAWLCNETGRPEIGRLDRERSGTNESFDHWHRGAIVRIEEIVRKERKGRESTIGRIPASARVEVIRSV